MDEQTIKNNHPVSLLPSVGKSLNKYYLMIWFNFYRKWTNFSEKVRIQTRWLL